jgi:ribosome maturation protein Sdo1
MVKVKTTYPYPVGDRVHLFGEIFDKETQEDGTFVFVAELDDKIAAGLIADGSVEEY